MYANQIRAVFPNLFGLRKVDGGFESLAVSPDGKRAITLLQSTIGTEMRGFDDADGSHIIYALSMDISDPLNLKPTGVYVYLADWADADGAGFRSWAVDSSMPKDISVHGAEWVGQHCKGYSTSAPVIAVMERGRMQVR